MKRGLVIVLFLVSVPGCALLPGRGGPAAPELPPPTGESVAPGTVSGAVPPPPATARTVEEFDTTSAGDRAAALAAATAAPARELGRTIASLGAAGEPGIWLKTPLVSAPARGRVDYPEKGTSVAVDLIPLAGGPGGGSRLSLAAMRLLQADLTALPELRVYLIAN